MYEIVAMKFSLPSFETCFVDIIIVLSAYFVLLGGCWPWGPSVKGFCTKLTDIGRLGGGGGGGVNPKPLSIIQKPHKDFTRTAIFF